jgi:hypothetical protein
VKSLALPSGGDGGELSGHAEVIALLLKHGARPHARDVCGKTIVHYGAGSHSTATSMELVQPCIDAAAQQDLPPLVNIQDRFGTVALHEVVMGNRLDAAKFLLKNGGDAKIQSYESKPMTPYEMANPLMMREMSFIFSKEPCRHTPNSALIPTPVAGVYSVQAEPETRRKRTCVVQPLSRDTHRKELLQVCQVRARALLLCSLPKVCMGSGSQARVQGHVCPSDGSQNQARQTGQ